jgi:hypothetical protein
MDLVFFQLLHLATATVGAGDKLVIQIFDVRNRDQGLVKGVRGGWKPEKTSLFIRESVVK